MRFSGPFIPALFLILCAAPCVAQRAAFPQEQTAKPALPKGNVPVYRLPSNAQVTFLKPDSPRVANAPVDGQRCYALRQYQFEQVDPQSDVTRFKNYSACQSAGQYRLKGAIVVPAPSR
jgi:hypothetical protein